MRVSQFEMEPWEQELNASWGSPVFAKSASVVQETGTIEPGVPTIENTPITVSFDVQRGIAAVGNGVAAAIGYTGEKETVTRPSVAEPARLGDFRVPLVGEFYD